MSHLSLYSVLLMVLFGLAQRSASSSSTYSLIARNVSLPFEDPQINSAAHFDERVSDLIAETVLRFGHIVGQRMVEDNPDSKTEVFSPVSIMAVLSMLMLGAKGGSHKELQRLFGLESDVELLNNPAKFYTELGYLLEDMQNHETHGLLRSRENAAWRTARPLYNLRPVLRRQNQEHMEHITKVANGIFTQSGYSLNPDYLHSMNSIYNSALESLDFAGKPVESREYINEWVERNTLGKIRNLLKQSLSSATKVIIASALYFKGFWEHRFIQTVDDDFYPNGRNRQPVKMRMMVTTAVFPYYLSAEYDCKIIGLPYKDNVTTMYVIQPNHSTRLKVKHLQRILDASKIEELISKMLRTPATVALPQMHFVSKMNLKSILSRLGVVDIFTQDVSDLSLIGGLDYSRGDDVQPLASQETLNRLHLDKLESERQRPSSRNSGLFVDEVIHQVDVDINEEGTEAAAATVALILKGGPGVLFRVDAPFLFLIRHDPTKLVLFYGMVNEPQL